MTFDCMTPEEYELWAAQEYQRASVPCVDCPLEFHLAEAAAGRCNKVREAAKPAKPEPRRYRTIAQRARINERNRLWMRRYRERLVESPLSGRTAV